MKECRAGGCTNPPRPRNGARGGIPLYCSETCRKREKERRERYGQHGSTLSDYDRLFVEQGGCCAICGSADPGGRTAIKRFAFDHDHVANRSRGLLCYLCNVGLGSFQDDPALLQAAIRYLERHAPTVEAIDPLHGATSAALTPR